MHVATDGMEEPQKLFRLPGTIEEEEEEREAEGRVNVEQPPRAESPLLAQKVCGAAPGIPRSITLVRVSTQSSSIGGVGRQDSNRSRYRAGPVRKIRRRAVLKNGECNVLQSKISRRSLRFLQDIFTTLVDTQWRWTLLCFTLSFLLSWLGFAVIWWLIAFTHGDFEEKHLPPNQIANNFIPCVYNINSFSSCFLFSIETQHTIGYGSRSTSEECPEAIFVMCIQSIAGVMIQAFMVGIVFAKMTRPKQRTQTLLFSRNAVICQRDGELCLMFRVGDMRKSHIIGASVRAQVIRTKNTKEGEVLSQFQQELVVGSDGNNSNLFFIWPTTIVHKINAESPFYNMSAEDMLSERFEIVVILEGTIESTGQTTQARSSYLPPEVLWGHRFESMVSYSKERQGYEVDYSLFNSTTQVDTPLCSGRELAEFYRVQDDLRHGAGYIVDEDGILVDPYHDMHAQHMAHHAHHPAAPGNHMVHAESTKSAASDNSLEDSALGRSLSYRDTSGPHFPHPHRDGHYKVVEIDPDAIQVIGDAELQHLPEAVNREILKNSREIVYDEETREPEMTREDSLLMIKPIGGKRGFVRCPLPDDEKRSLNGSRRNLSSRNFQTEEDKRSLNGSRRNLHGSKRYLLMLEKPESWQDSNRNFYLDSKENLAGPRRYTGSKERLNVIRKNVSGMTGSLENPELRSRRRLNEVGLDHGEAEVEIEIEKPAKTEFSVDLRDADPDGYASPQESILTSPTDSILISPVDSNPSPSDLSPESGFVEDAHEQQSPETLRRHLRLPGVPAVIRNRRSYEHAQLQDVNEVLASSASGSSSSDSDSPTRKAPTAAPRKNSVPTTAKQKVSYTSV